MVGGIGVVLLEARCEQAMVQLLEGDKTGVMGVNRTHSMGTRWGKDQ